MQNRSLVSLRTEQVNHLDDLQKGEVVCPQSIILNPTITGMLPIMPVIIVASIICITNSRIDFGLEGLHVIFEPLGAMSHRTHTLVGLRGGEMMCLIRRTCMVVGSHQRSFEVCPTPSTLIMPTLLCSEGEFVVAVGYLCFANFVTEYIQSTRL